MKSKLIGTAIFALTAATVLFYPTVRSHGVMPGQTGTPPIAAHVLPPLQGPAPRVEVVFVLDTTGSMGGLIEAAKEKIWSIASTMAAAQPAPEIRMGLVAYRDRGDQYVTRIVDLSDDLDSMYATLMSFQAEGGGDGPESVNEALHEAVNGISWSQDQNAYRVVFLVGDAPPHMDYPDDVKYPLTLGAAREKGIVVNTIQCGRVGSTTPPWRQIASLGAGRYFEVEQSGSALAVTTPFDSELAKLSAALDGTRMYYGSREEKAKMRAKVAATEKLHAASSDESRARRAAFNASAAGRVNFLGRKELIDEIASGRLDLDSIESEALPAAMQAMEPEAQKRLIEETAKKREELNRQIGRLAARRDAFIAEKVEEAGGAEDSLDHKIYEAVREQAAEAGLEYKAGPSY